MKVGRIHRILHLLTILQSGTGMTVEELSEELNVSRRTIFRDLSVIVEAGIPCYFQTGHGYRISSCFFLPPLSLEAGEAMGLMVLTKHLQHAHDQPYTQAAMKAIRKLLSMMKESAREVCGELTDHLSVHPGSTAASGGSTDEFSLLLRAINENFVIQAQVITEQEAPPTEISFRPYHLRLVDRSWYVFGYSEPDRCVIALPTAQMQNLSLTQRRFKLEKPFEVEAFLGRCWRVRPEGQIYDIELVFSSVRAREMGQVVWHLSQQTEWLADGRCLLRFQVDGLEEIARWLTQFGEDVEIRRPSSLAHRLFQLCRDQAAHHGRRFSPQMTGALHPAGPLTENPEAAEEGS